MVVVRGGEVGRKLGEGGKRMRGFGNGKWREPVSSE